MAYLDQKTGQYDIGCNSEIVRQNIHQQQIIQQQNVEFSWDFWNRDWMPWNWAKALQKVQTGYVYAIGGAGIGITTGVILDATVAKNTSGVLKVVLPLALGVTGVAVGLSIAPKLDLG
jgi:hypothetical protein